MIGTSKQEPRLIHAVTKQNQKFVGNTREEPEQMAVNRLIGSAEQNRDRWLLKRSFSWV